MDRLDKAIADVNYILNCLRVYRDIVNSGCCNQCEKLKECEYKPAWGSQTRYNCPFFERWSVRT